jgi:hypothetical protein
MGAATREFYIEVLNDALRIIDDADADHLVIGSIATKCLLSQSLDPTEDLDVLVRPKDTERLLDAFSKNGYATHRRDPRWIYKAGRPDVTIDLIFRAGESIELDEQHLARGTTKEIDGLSLPVPAPEDLAIMKAVFDRDDRPGRWYEAIALLRGLPIDWDYLTQRGRDVAPRKVLSLLLYAADAGIPVPDEAFSRLELEKRS